MSIYDPRIVDRLIARATAHKDYLKQHGIEYVGEGNIGFSEKEQKWYGWSHRGRCGFEVGDEIEEGDLTGGLPVGFKAKTLEDAKAMAIAFADAVS